MLILILALGCRKGLDIDTGPIDADGDGVSLLDDCDDNDATAYPGADEVCDAVDNDCDGEIDEDPVDGSSYYVDADTDGYGAGLALRACEAPSGYAELAGDCDDDDDDFHPGAVEDDCADPNDYNCDGSVGYTDEDGDGWPACLECDDEDADVNPDATEICNEVDDDCNGETDEGVSLSFYVDADGDGFGTGDELSGCEIISGFSAIAGDCDDEKSEINPDATEVCDTVDNDCDGTTDNDEDVLGVAGCAAASCLDILDTLTTAPSDGSFIIDAAADGTETQVYCDMTTDGGGYTYLKVDYGSSAYAADAQAYCAALGMQLFIPRTEAHKDASLAIAEDANIGPEGGLGYMYILGIYPDVSGASVGAGSACKYTAFDSDSCTNWGTDDGGPYWVSSRTDITEPNGDCGTTSSMYYTWDSSTYKLSWYNDIPSPGYASQTFMCDVGDFWGP